MRTNFDIDDELLARTQAVAGTKGKKATVQYALRELVRRRTVRVYGRVVQPD